MQYLWCFLLLLPALLRSFQSFGAHSERARYECAPHAIRHSLGLSYEYLFRKRIVHAVGYHVLETRIQTPFASSCRSFRHSAKAERRIDEGKNGIKKSEQQHDATSNFCHYSFCLAINFYYLFLVWQQGSMLTRCVCSRWMLPVFRTTKKIMERIVSAWRNQCAFCEPCFDWRQWHQLLITHRRMNQMLFPAVQIQILS